MKTASVTSTFSFQDYCDNVAIGLAGWCIDIYYAIVELCQPVYILLHHLYCCRYICSAISVQDCFTICTDA